MQLRTLQAWLSSGLILVFPASITTFFTWNLPTSSSGGWESSSGVSHEVMYCLTQSVPGREADGMCRWMRSYFHDWIDNNEVAHFRIFGDKTPVLHISTVSKRTRMFAL